MPAAAKTQGRLLPLQPARRPTRCARRGALVSSPKGQARRLVAGGHLPVLDHLPTRLPAAQNRDGEPDLHLHTQHPRATAAGQRRCRRRVRPPRSARGAPLPRLLAALLRNRGAPAAARISAEIAIERLGSSAPATLPWGARRAASRLEKAPRCTSCTGMANAAPNPGGRAALHLRARVPILRAESRRSGPTPAAAPHAGKQRRAPQGRRGRAPRPSRGWRCRPRPRRRLCCPPLRTAR